MTSQEIREKFLDFFKARGHEIVQSSSLIPTDPSVLLTTAGMQQFKPYFTGEKDPGRDFGTQRTASIQKCFRTSDIDEVGDESHLTFFEMLGNFSFGPVGSDDPNDFGKSGYFKRSAIFWAHEFITKELGLKIDYVTIFGGGKNKNGVEIPYDERVEKIWQELGVMDIHTAGMEDNFWGPTGNEGPCGPTTEIYAGGIEIWNIVFNEYYCDSSGNLKKLENPGVDTGMGLERLATVLQGENNVFETDLLEPIIKEISGENDRAKRIITDHIKSAVFLASEGILPSNLDRGYILRRLIRRIIRYGRTLNLSKNFLIDLAKKVVEIYKDVYPELSEKENAILTIMKNEKEKFEKTIQEGLKKGEEIFNKKTPIPPDIYFRIMQIKDKKEVFRKIYRNKSNDDNDFENRGISITIKQILDATISGKEAFYLFQSFGFPIEMIVELAQEKNIFVDIESFNEELEKHKEISRAGAEKKFGGHGIENEKRKTKNEKLIRLHTASHLLQAALKKVLGPEITQKGSDITEERTRFDFSFPRKMTPDELKKVEEIVNDVIKKDLPVIMEEMAFEEAVRKNAYYAPNFNYPERVKVYSILDRQNGEEIAVSREICGGPHVENTGEIGKFRIIKEESVSEGTRRLRAVIE